MSSSEKFGGKIFVLDDERLSRMTVCARLMVRQLCDGIQRQRFGALNETIFHIPRNANKDE